MSEKTSIAWCRSTFNPFIGCTKVGPGCDHCYAEALDKRHKWGGAVHWGPGVPRYRTSATNWKQPLLWNKKAEEEHWRGQRDGIPGEFIASRPGFWPVFCASLADVFDNEVPEEWRRDLWRLIKATQNLEWLLVTKRIGNVTKMVPPLWLTSSTDGFPPNVRILITVVNQEEADRDIPKLLALPCKNGISYEPALGPVDWSRWLAANDLHKIDGGPRLDWIIVGGESGPDARPFDLGWARKTVEQCTLVDVPVFVKQLGAQPIVYATTTPGQRGPIGAEESVTIKPFRDRAGADPSEWPDRLRVQEFPL